MLVGSSFSCLGGRKIETDPSELVSRGKDLPPTVGVVESAGIGLDPVGSSSGSGLRMGLDCPK